MPAHQAWRANPSMRMSFEGLYLNGAIRDAVLLGFEP